jgi:hypothetical protein
MKAIVVLAIIVSAYVAESNGEASQFAEKQQDEKQQDEKQQDEKQRALTQTGASSEPSTFWTGIAENSSIDTCRRGLAIYFLFERHVRKSISLGELAVILNKPTWIKKDDVSIITKNSPLALNFTPGDTMFVVEVFASDVIKKHNAESIRLYMNVGGVVDKGDFVSTLLGGHATKNSVLKGWAFNPAWDDYVKNASATLKQ